MEQSTETTVAQSTETTVASTLSVLDFYPSCNYNCHNNIGFVFGWRSVFY